MAKGSVTGRTAAAMPRVRRGYFECRYGQLHVHNSIPPGGGFDEATSIVCLHDFPYSGHAFDRLLGVLGRDRSVYAPDLPGYGASDAPSGRPTIADYAAAIGDFCDLMRFRQVDVLGYRSGSLIAIELALARPAVIRRLVLFGVPIPSDAEREAFRRAPWPVAPQEDGAHLGVEWKRSLEARGTGVPLATVARSFADKLSHGAEASWGIAATLGYSLRERLSAVTQPVLIVRARDALADSTARARELHPRARFAEIADAGSEPLETAPEAVVSALRDFTRG